MKRSLTLMLSIPTICAWSIFLVGCGAPSAESTDTTAAKQEQANDHDDHDDAPESYAAAVAVLKEHYSSIKTAFESGNDHDAHDPLHHVGHVLESIPDLAQSEELSAEQVQTVQQAVDKMFEAYGQLDQAMHANETPDYAAVSDTLDTNMNALEEAVPQ